MSINNADTGVINNQDNNNRIVIASPWLVNLVNGYSQSSFHCKLMKVCTEELGPFDIIVDRNILIRAVGPIVSCSYWE